MRGTAVMADGKTLETRDNSVGEFCSSKGRGPRRAGHVKRKSLGFVGGANRGGEGWLSAEARDGGTLPKGEVGTKNNYVFYMLGKGAGGRKEEVKKIGLPKKGEKFRNWCAGTGEGGRH